MFSFWTLRKLRATFMAQCVGYYCMHFKLHFWLKFPPLLFFVSSLALASIYAIMLYCVFL